MKLLIVGLCGQSVFLRVPHFHKPEETLHASSLFTEPGGKGYNQAVAARRMGAQVMFCGAIGHDADGTCCTKRLLEEGIVPRMAEKEGSTAYAVILTDDAGENRVTVYPGVQLSSADVGALEPEFKAADMLLLTPEIPEDAFCESVRLAKAHGVRIILNPAPYAAWVKAYLADAWLITPNRSEACAMLESDEAGLMDSIAHAPYPRMVVTLGGVGAVCAENGVITHIPAKQVQAVDTTGAGDCLNGVLCARLLAGDSLLEAAKTAVRAATFSVTRAHVLDAMPHAREIE